MIDIKFSYNWNNKLDCHAFTSIRLFNPYRHVPGTKVKLFLKDKEIGTGTIESVKRFLLKDMTTYMSWLDMGYNVAEGSKVITTMYPKIDFSTKQLAFLLIVKDKPATGSGE